MSHKKYRTEPECLNCGAIVAGKFCSDCGQENIETREKFFHLVTEFVSDYFHFDSKFFRSLIPLFTKPGFLTKEYWEGRRVRYIHPLRLYFFITIIFMIVATAFYSHFKDKLREAVVYQTEDTVAEAREKGPVLLTMDDDDKAVPLLRQGMDYFFRDLKYISFFMLPVWALIFHMLYIRRKGFYVDHLVYTVHMQSLSYILVTIALLLAFVWPDYISLIRRITVITLGVYVAASLRYLYHQSWWKTILKSMVATFTIIAGMGLVMGIYMATNYLIHRP